MFLGKSYKKWEKSAVEQLQSVPQAHKGELKVTYVFQMKGKYKVDLDNLIVGINDVLQAANVIENDDSITEIKAKKLGGFDDWTTYVIIE